MLTGVDGATFSAASIELVLTSTPSRRGCDDACSFLSFLSKTASCVVESAPIGLLMLTSEFSPCSFFEPVASNRLVSLMTGNEMTRGLVNSLTGTAQVMCCLRA